MRSCVQALQVRKKSRELYEKYQVTVWIASGVSPTINFFLLFLQLFFHLVFGFFENLRFCEPAEIFGSRVVIYPKPDHILHCLSR
jgi:hypothetical protein